MLLDDRDQRAGEKFADADLIGAPTRVTVGKKTLDDGAVDVRSRATGDERRVPMAELGALPQWHAGGGASRRIPSGRRSSA